MRQNPQQAQPVKPAAPQRPPLPEVPPEFNAEAILRLDAAKLVAMVKDPAATVFQRAKACHQLAVKGGREAVPALAALLTHAELSGYARFALEPNPDPSADAALRAALGKVQGKLLAGVATSLGVRKDAASAAPLAKLLSHEDDVVAGAAAAALGRIGGPVAAKALREAAAGGREALRPVMARACLICADTSAAANKALAADLYKFLSEPARGRAVRLSAIRAMGGQRNPAA